MHTLDDMLKLVFLNVADTALLQNMGHVSSRKVGPDICCTLLLPLSLLN